METLDKKTIDADSEAGITVSLIDAVISICNIISTRDLFDDDGVVQEAIKDLRSNDGVKRLMDIGELQDAKDYIKEQKRTIKLLLAMSKITDEGLEKFGEKLKNFRENPNSQNEPVGE